MQKVTLNIISTYLVEERCHLQSIKIKIVIELANKIERVVVHVFTNAFL